MSCKSASGRVQNEQGAQPSKLSLTVNKCQVLVHVRCLHCSQDNKHNEPLLTHPKSSTSAPYSNPHGGYTIPTKIGGDHSSRNRDDISALFQIPPKLKNHLKLIMFFKKSIFTLNSPRDPHYICRLWWPDNFPFSIFTRYKGMNGQTSDWQTKQCIVTIMASTMRE